MDDAQILTRAIEDWLISYLSKRLGIAADRIDPRQTLMHYGLASTEALNLVRELENWLGHPLSPTVAWNYPTIADLAQHLADDPDISKKTKIITPCSAKRPLSDAALLEPVAIVGMGCRFPGAPDLESFWQLLCDGRDAITTVPPDRWDTDALFDPDASKPGKTISRWGGFLEHLDRFDASFFGISPREAPHLDPRQRLTLEVTWEALEDAGIPFNRLMGSRTGVFVATLSADYGDMLFRDLNRVDAYSGPGTANSVISNRISYFFDLHGPSLSLDTACSGSLVAIHLACQSLRYGECTLAVAGGVSVNLLPNGNVFFSKAGVLSPHGRCKPFDSRADGIVRSEGIGIVVLKPLFQAQADGDRIYAVICGSAVNQDGRSNGLMAPNGQAQQVVLREAYQRAGISPASVQCVETHGTGTRLGDPIEVEALGAVFSDGRSPRTPCALGSLKSNLGHMEPAAGVASVIKTALAINHRLLPPTLHFQEPSPLIAFQDLPFVVQETLGPWPVESEPLVAGVSSFGFGGTNAHLVLSEAPQPDATFSQDVVAAGASTCLLPLSARSPQALTDLADVYRQFLATQTTRVWCDICYTASVRRTHHRESRLALVAHSSEEAAAHLAAFLRGEKSAWLAADSSPGRPFKIAFVFSGQGSHWARMGCELDEQEPVFRATLQACDRLLRQHTDWSLLEELRRSEAESRLNETERAQPAIFAIQVALAALWRSWGIDPDWVVGQSLGEVAAAHVGGALDLEDAIRVVVQRSRLMKRAEGQGKTALVGLSAEQAQLALAGHKGGVVIAGSSSPNASVLAGDSRALADVLASLEKQGVFCRLLHGVDVAFHSPQMEPLRGELVEALAGLRPRPASVAIYSTVIGDLVVGDQLDAAYWGRNLREPFLFADAVQKLIQSGCEAFLEIGPHPVLDRAIQDGLRYLDREGHVWASLRRNEPQRETLLASLGALYAAGFSVNWSKLHPEGGQVVSLPAYPWQRERYWFDQLGGGPTVSPSFTVPKTGGSYPLLGEHIQLATAPRQHVWETDLAAHSLHYLADHRVRGVVVMPGAAYAEMALTAASQAFSAGPYRLTDVAFERPLVLPETGWRRLQLLVAPHVSSEATFCFASRDASVPEEWTLHATGKIRYGDGQKDEQAPLQSESLDAIRARCQEQVLANDHYQAMAARGLQYGQSFQAVTQIWRRDGEVLASLQLAEYLNLERPAYQVHPVLLDAGFQTVALASASGDEADGTYLPVGIEGLQVYAQPESQAWCHVRLRPGTAAGDAVRIADIDFLDLDGQLVAAVEGLRLQRLAAAGTQQDVRQWLYAVEWQPLQTPAATTAVRNWLIFADRGGLGQALAAQVEALGGQCSLVFASEPGMARPSGQEYTIAPDDRAAFQTLLARTQQNGTPYQGIIYLWGLDLSLPQDGNADRLFAGVYAQGCLPVLYLVQALAQAGWAKLPRLWLVTQEAQAVGAAADVSGVNVVQAPLWGMGQVIAREYPEAWGGLIDLESCDKTQLASSLLEICRHPGDQDAFAIRDNQRYVACLVRRPELAVPDQDGALPLRPDASYLITGGLGGLGLCLAEWLAEQGARRLVLLGRTPLPPRSRWNDVVAGSPLAERIAAIRCLEKMGTTVYVAAADVADAEQLTAFLAAYDQAGWPPIRGVVHAAGVLQDQLLINMTADALETVLRPKVLGAWLLHRLLADAPLDFFVMFSSVAALLGQMGQANYAAGNAFMDALAHYRRRLGLSATSINWGVWARVGMAAQRNLQEQFERLGMYTLLPAQALSLMGPLLSRQVTQVAVVNADWGKLQRASSGPAPLLAQLARQDAGTGRGPGDDGGAPQDEAATQLLLIIDPAERQAGLEAYLRDLAARTLRLDDARRLPTNQSLTALGMDSIMAVELKNRIEAHLPLTLSVAELIVGVSVAELAGKLNAQLEVDEEIATLLDEVEGISMEEVEARLE